MGRGNSSRCGLARVLADQARVDELPGTTRVTTVPTFDEDDRGAPGWEPEPLELPIEAPVVSPPTRERGRPSNDQHSDEESGDDRTPGVIVIDLC
jgi:hypothetical protein